ncbi:hypothetical protein D9757_003424 [Collybiopsis confluens]|uniref:PH domain-containing protein n=1 Tax=Collybiopsis confluens TaxID=2823264 RepID=A0A8H5HU05_9AGAR|nr:hypothetical protein D9757_003424 [Collybiopsis confluens]
MAPAALTAFYDELGTSNIAAFTVPQQPASLLDSDPFADLSAPPTPPTPLTSPLTPKFPLPRHTSPSLPSLATLAKMNVTIPRKIRRGNVGARLPFEPWDLLPPETPSHSLASEDEDYGELVNSPTRPRFSQLPLSPACLYSGPSSSSSSSFDVSSVSSSSSSEIHHHCELINIQGDPVPAVQIDHTTSSSSSSITSTVQTDSPSSSLFLRRRMSAQTAEMWIRGGNASSEQRGHSSNSTAWSNTSSNIGRARSAGRSLDGNGGYDSDRDRRNHSLPTSFLHSFSSEDEVEDDSGDDYGPPPTEAPLPPARANSDDDDVPLARSIPTALKAQQSIRIKDREAREKRRREREARAAARNNQQAALRSPLSSSSQEAAFQASNAPRLPRRVAAHSTPLPFGIEELSQKLENVRYTNQSNARSAPLPPSSPPPQDMASHLPARTIRPMRSFHKSEPRKFTDDWNQLHIPLEPEIKARARSRSTASREDPTSHARSPHLHPPPPPPPAVDDFGKLERKRTVKTTADAAGVKAGTLRTSIEPARSTPLPAPAEVIPRQNNTKVTLIQQRVFIGDRQRFVVIEISPSTSAGDVIHMVESQGALKEWRGSGGWMLFEIAQDFGMERPVRDFELLSDIEAAWNKDKLVNVFMLKLTPLAPILRRSAIPSSSPTHFGYVEWESKRGKWNKRYLMLKEHALWISKRDNASIILFPNGRDEVLLCSLSNFDAYQFTRLVKAPKEFTFAVKSTDNLSFFEDTADYMHVFSCKAEAGGKWMEKILLARSYVLHQERNILFNKTPKSPPSAPAVAAQSGATGLSRSITKKAAPQPFVNHDPDSIFEPGSLLRS